MRVLEVSDLHFTSKTSDEHFWRLFPYVQQLAHDLAVDEIVILGDLTTAKDNHSAKLVNRVVDGLVAWTTVVNKVRVLMGNHDYAASSDHPFFSFLGHYPKIEYVTKPTIDKGLAFLPHTRNPAEDWKEILPQLGGKIVFAHVSVEGAVYESGVTSEEGLDPQVFSHTRLTFSGDIHSRQQIGPVIYVGCPYQVRFNDQFQGGGVLLDTDTTKWEYLDFPFPKRVTVNCQTVSGLETATEHLKPDDQLKVRLNLTQSNMGRWRELKEGIQTYCEEKGFVLHAFEMIRAFNETIPKAEQAQDVIAKGVTDFQEFCESQKISAELRAVGESIIKEAV